MNKPQAIVWNFISPEYHPPTGNLSTLPTYIDFRFVNIIREKDIKFGLVKSHIYYEYFDFEQKKYINPLVNISWDTFFDEDNNLLLPFKRIRKFSCLLSDGTWSEPIEKVEPIRKPKVFLQKMRGRVIEELIDIADSSGLGDKIRTLYEAHSQEIFIYKEGGSPKFRDAIATADEAWLDILNSETGNKPRDVIVQYLSIGVVDD